MLIILSDLSAELMSLSFGEEKHKTNQRLVLCMVHLHNNAITIYVFN